MRLNPWVGIASIAMVSPLFAASVVDFTVEVAPYNPAYVTAWKAGTPIAFAPGSPADGQQFVVGDIITWDVVVALDPTGAHEQPGHPSNGFRPYGVSNIVFNLELLDQNDLPVNTGQYFSAINDGTGTDPIAAAAFAASFSVTGRGPGRLIDQILDTTPPHGGPNLGLSTPPTLMQSEGKLLGQGAGYTEWVRSGGNATRTTAGIGLVTLPDTAQTAGLGVVPVCEGQIDTTNMAPGVYKLKVVPGAGINVLRGDIPFFLFNNAEAFAVAANQVFGSVITFTLTTEPDCEAPQLLSATSVRTHGNGVGPMALPLNLVGAPSVESRDGGPQQIVLVYDKPIAAADGLLDTEVSLSVGQLAGVPVMNGEVLTINLTGVPDISCLALTINGITCAEGGLTAPEHLIRVMARKGDINGNGVVNVADIGLVKSFSGTAVGINNFRADLNLNGVINVSDIGVVKSLSGGLGAPLCP